MDVRLKWILATYILCFGVATVQPFNQMADQFHNYLFNSIAKNDEKNIHQALKREVAGEQEAFNTMNKELDAAHFKNSVKKRNRNEYYNKEVKRSVVTERDRFAVHLTPDEMWEDFGFENFEVLPEVIIFDIDFTLWPFLVDHHAAAPFTRNENGTLMDSRNRRVSWYKGVPEMLQLLREHRVKIGVVNYTKKPEDVKKLLNALGWMEYISYIMLTTGPAQERVKALIEKEKLEYRNVLYFDELPFHLAKAEELGIISALAEYGMNPDSLENGLKQYVDRYKNPRTRGREEIFDEATAGRIKLKATTPISPWTSRTTASYYFVCTPVASLR